uniref:START domain-containing protein n=1 Tax=Heligmosomoides polygyrus TaxID=6339 RepID=A0A183G8R1_HELPZ
LLFIPCVSNALFIYRFIPSAFLLNAKVRESIAEYEPSNNIEETLGYFTNRVQGRLNTVMPEFETISCSTAFLYDEPSVDEQLVRLCKWVLFKHLLIAFEGYVILQTFTVASAIDGREVPCERIMPNTSNSFRVSALHRWGNHPVLSEVSFYVKNDIGGIVFCTPSIVRCTELTLMDTGLDDSFPWRLGFFNAWDQWSLPIRDSTKRLRACVPLGKQIAVVPVSSMFPDFNTFSLLPRITADLVGFLLNHRCLMDNGDTEKERLNNLFESTILVLTRRSTARASNTQGGVFWIWNGKTLFLR